MTKRNLKLLFHAEPCKYRQIRIGLATITHIRHAIKACNQNTAYFFWFIIEKLLTTKHYVIFKCEPQPSNKLYPSLPMGWYLVVILSSIYEPNTPTSLYSPSIARHTHTHSDILYKETVALRFQSWRETSLPPPTHITSCHWTGPHCWENSWRSASLMDDCSLHTCEAYDRSIT